MIRLAEDEYDAMSTNKADYVDGDASDSSKERKVESPE